MEVERSDSWPVPAKPVPSGSPPAEPRDDWRVVWAFVAILVAFKLAGLAIIVAICLQTAEFDEALPFLAASHVPFVVGALLLLYWPVKALFRRLRLRARRRQLIYAEWHVEKAGSSTAGS